MARSENPPFERGTTWYNGATIDSNNLGGLNIEGKEWVFEDIDLSASASVGAKPARTNRYVRCRAVRNVAAIALLPKRLARFQKSGVNYGARVDGYTALGSERGYPIDEFLPAAGVPVNDIFWLVVDGPAKVLAPLAGADFGATSFVEGDILVALTAITSGSTTAGRVKSQPFTGATTDVDTVIFDSIQNAVGRVLSATTSGQTNGDVLIEVGKW